MKIRFNYAGWLLFPLGILVACENKITYPDTTQYKTEITSIKIVNGGLGGSETIEGTVNEREKKISFPEMHKDSDLSALKFDVQTSDTRAHLDSLNYNFVMEEGKSERTRTIKLVNHIRYREYSVTIKLNAPVFGADFTKSNVKVYDFTGNSTIYPDLSGELTRCADMDLKHVLMISRTETGPHLLKLEDIKKGEVDKPIKLDMTGVKGGTFPYSSGALSHGHIYICNLSIPSGSPFKIYHWASAEAAAEELAAYTDTDLEGYESGTGRFGDFMSVDLNSNGTGYMFFGVNPSPTAYKILRVKVTEFTKLSDPKLINTQVAPDGSPYAGFWASYNKIAGSDDFLYGGHQALLMVANEDGKILYTVPEGFIAKGNCNDAHIIDFNQERYLVTMSTPGAGKVNIWDVTKGEGAVEALKKLVSDKSEPLFDYSLKGDIKAGTAVGIIGWAKDGNETLYIMGAAPRAGFVLMEFPKKSNEKKP